MELIHGILGSLSKKMIICQLIVVICLSMVGCEQFSDSIEAEGNICQDSLNNADVDNEVERNVEDNYKIYRGSGEKDFWYFYYDLYDSEGNVVKHQCTYMEQPLIENVFQDILKISVQAGTGLGSCWTYYYDIKNHTFSPTYYYVLDEALNQVVYCTGEKIAISQIFTGEISAELEIPKEYSKEAQPVNEAVLSENFKKITIIYSDGRTECFELEMR